jgi:transcriptional regulator with XRE-family HTH domain
MQSYQITLTPHKRAAGRFIAMVRREIQKALAEEQVNSGITQAAVAVELGVNRSVIHRQIMGFENLTLGTAAEIASALGREPLFSMQPISASSTFNHVPVQAGTSRNQGS